jgi:hypothetical protein
MNFGIDIDRGENKKKNLKEMSPFFMDIPNMTIYGPSNPLLLA